MIVASLAREREPTVAAGRSGPEGVVVVAVLVLPVTHISIRSLSYMPARRKQC